MQVFDIRTGTKIVSGKIVKLIYNADSDTVCIDISTGHRVVLASEEIERLDTAFAEEKYDEYH